MAKKTVTVKKVAAKPTARRRTKKVQKPPVAKPAKRPASARKPIQATPLQARSAAPASGAKKPIAARLPMPATVAKPARVAAPTLPDPLDETPTPTIPGVYTGWFKGEGNHAMIAYQRGEFKVHAVLLAQPITLIELPVDQFDANMHRAKLNGYGYYPVKRAVEVYLASYNGWTDKALKVLRRLRDNRPVDEEDTLEDILDMTPTRPHKLARVRHQGRSKEERKVNRRKNRLARLAKMNATELKAWRDSRKAKRQARKAAMKG